MSPTLKKHLAAIQSGAITKTNVIGLRKAYNAHARQAAGWSIGLTSPRVTGEDIGEIRRAITMHEPRVSRELDASGRKVLQDPRYRKRWTVGQARIISEIEFFRFVGFRDIDVGHYVPIYKVVSMWGNINFIVIPWQTAYYLGEISGPQIIGDYF